MDDLLSRPPHRLAERSAAAGNFADTARAAAVAAEVAEIVLVAVLAVAGDVAAERSMLAAPTHSVDLR